MSFYRLADAARETGVDFSWAYRRLCQLRERGLIAQRDENILDKNEYSLLTEYIKCGRRKNKRKLNAS
jgi:DNA-binding IclR family transcriptional regulator